jgi:hypothetical protein
LLSSEAGIRYFSVPAAGSHCCSVVNAVWYQKPAQFEIQAPRPELDRDMVEKVTTSSTLTIPTTTIVPDV